MYRPGTGTCGIEHGAHYLELKVSYVLFGTAVVSSCCILTRVNWSEMFMMTSGCSETLTLPEDVASTALVPLEPLLPG